MPRPRASNKRRITSSVAAGYAELVGNVWYTRIGGRRQSTFLNDHPDNEPRVRELLEERSIDHALMKLGRAPLAAPARMSTTVFDLVDEYKQVRGATIPKNSLVIFEQMCKEYFPVNLELEYESLYWHLVGALERSTMKQSTKRKRLQQLRKMLRFAIERGYIDRNPVDVIGIPKNPRKAENVVYTHSEVDRIVDELASRPNLQQYAHFFRFLSLTAMRVGEALKLRWSDIDERAIRIDGKGERRRNFPLAVFPEVRAVLDEMRAFSSKNRGYVFRWRYPSQPQWHLKRSKQRLHARKKWTKVDDGRAIHTFRATAEHWWKTELGLPVETVCKLAGHSIAVHVRDYHATPSADELATEVLRGSAKSQPNNPTFHGLSPDSTHYPETTKNGHHETKSA